MWSGGAVVMNTSESGGSGNGGGGGRDQQHSPATNNTTSSHPPPATSQQSVTSSGGDPRSIWGTLWSIWGGSGGPQSEQPPQPQAPQPQPPTSTEKSSHGSGGTHNTVSHEGGSTKGSAFARKISFDTMSVRPNPVKFVSSSHVCMLVLSLWDNITGPRVEQIWTRDWDTDKDIRIIEEYISTTTTTPSSLNNNNPANTNINTNINTNNANANANTDIDLDTDIAAANTPSNTAEPLNVGVSAATSGSDVDADSERLHYDQHSYGGGSCAKEGYYDTDDHDPSSHLFSHHDHQHQQQNRRRRPRRHHGDNDAATGSSCSSSSGSINDGDGESYEDDYSDRDNDHDHDDYDESDDESESDGDYEVDEDDPFQTQFLGRSTDPSEIAKYISRYTLGGELVEIAAANSRAAASGVGPDANTYDLDSANPSGLILDPLNLTSSPTPPSTTVDSSSVASGNVGATSSSSLTTTTASTSKSHGGGVGAEASGASLEEGHGVSGGNGAGGASAASLLSRSAASSSSDQANIIIDHKMHVFEQANYFSEAAVFSAPYEAGGSGMTYTTSSSSSSSGKCTFQKTKFAFSLVLLKSDIDQYVRHHDAIVDKLQQLVITYVYLIQLRPASTALNMLTPTVHRIFHQINHLMDVYPGSFMSGGMTRQQPALQQTIFASADLDPLQVLSGTELGPHAPPNSHPSFHSSDSIHDYGSFADFDSVGSVGGDTISAGSSPSMTSSPDLISSPSSPISATPSPLASTGASSGGGSSGGGPLETQQSQELREKRARAKNFLTMVLTSHFQTHQRTVVLGEDVALVNLFVNTLSLFISPADRERSALAVPGRTSHIPDLVVQGVIGRKILDESIIQSMLPTTLVDLNQGVVTQTYPFHEYKVLRREFQKLLIQKMIKATNKTNLWEAQESVFQPVKGSMAPCVKRIVQETIHLPPYLRLGYINASLRSLISRCYVLIKYVESFSRQHQLRQQREKKRAQQQLAASAAATATTTTATTAATPATSTASTGSSVGMAQQQQPPQSHAAVVEDAAQPNNDAPPSAEMTMAMAVTGDHTSSDSLLHQQQQQQLQQQQQQQHQASVPPSMQYGIELSSNPAIIKRIRQDLDLSEPCYYVMLGLAELIKPGIFRALAGDPASQELRWIELFESF